MNLQFDDRQNDKTLNHKTGGINTSWSTVNKMVLDLIALDDANNDLQFDTSVVGQTVTVRYPSNGTLIFKLEDQSIATGSYIIELVAVDSSDNITQIIHPSREYITFSFSVTMTI